MPDIKEMTVNIHNEKLGLPISEDLSNLLKRYTVTRDRSEACRRTGVGTSTLRDVAFGYNNLTEENSKALYELIKIAIENGMTDLKEISIAVAELKSIIKK